MDTKKFKTNTAGNHVIIAGYVSKVCQKTNTGVDFYLRRDINKEKNENFIDVPCCYTFFKDSKGENMIEKIIKGAKIFVDGHFESKVFKDVQNDKTVRENCVYVEMLECFNTEEELKKLRLENETNNSTNVGVSKDIENGKFVYVYQEIDDEIIYEKINKASGKTEDLFFATIEDVNADIQKDKDELKKKLKASKK
jgi:hypothetical protein